MNRAPLVSIVVNNYNYGRFLGEAIDSALNQAYLRTEVVVVDDGSTDNSREIIAGYGKKITPVLKKNGGQASAFNAGFAASQGEIVLFLDADDYLFPRTVERVVAAWDPDVAKVQYRVEKVDVLGSSMGLFDPPGNTPMKSGEEVRRALLKRGVYAAPPTSGRAFSRAVLRQVLPVPEAEFQISADGYLLILVPFYGSVVSIGEALGAYRIHGSNRWATGAVSSGELRKLLQFDSQLQALLAHKAEEMGYKVPKDLGVRDYGSLLRRMAFVRLDPQKKHSVSSDLPPRLAYWGLRAVWRYSDLNWKRRLMYSAWFAWVGLLPLPLAKPAVAWMFAPQSRPKALDWLRVRIRF